MTDAPVQNPFESRVMQWALSQVISEEDAQSLASLIMRLTADASAWADPNLLRGEEIALKALICAEVMRAFSAKAGKLDKTDTPDDDHKGDAPSFANICVELPGVSAPLTEDSAWQDFVRYNSLKFRDDVLAGLKLRLSSLEGLGPYQGE